MSVARSGSTTRSVVSSRVTSFDLSVAPRSGDFAFSVHHEGDYDVTVEDPGAYTKPFVMHGHSAIAGGELMEYVCNENNQDVSHIVGKDTRK